MILEALLLQPIFATVTQHMTDYEIQSNPTPLSFIQDNTVERLNLKNFGLESLPSCISRLENLKILNLQDNQLKSLPRSLEKMSSIISINLFNNPDLPNYVEELNLLGKFELIEIFGDKILSNNFQKINSVNEKTFSENMNSRRLRWNMDSLRKLKFQKWSTPYFNMEEMISIVEDISKIQMLNNNGFNSCGESSSESINEKEPTSSESNKEEEPTSSESINEKEPTSSESINEKEPTSSESINEKEPTSSESINEKEPTSSERNEVSISNNDMVSCLSLYDKEILINYIKMLHIPNFEYSGWILDKEKVLQAKCLLISILKSFIDEIMDQEENNMIPSPCNIKFYIDELLKIIKTNYPSKQITNLRFLSIIVNNKDKSANEVYILIGNLLTSLKENTFETMMRLAYSQHPENIKNHACAYWGNRLKEILGLDYPNPVITLIKAPDEPFKFNRYSVLNTFFEIFTPEYAIKVLTKELQERLEDETITKDSIEKILIKESIITENKK